MTASQTPSSSILTQTTVRRSLSSRGPLLPLSPSCAFRCVYLVGLPTGRRRYLDAVLDRDRYDPLHILRAFGDQWLRPVHSGLAYLLEEALVQASRCLAHQHQIGRASCRERV